MWNPRTVVVSVLDWDVVVSEFVFRWHYCAHFWTNTFGKGMNSLTPFRYKSNSTTTVLQQIWLRHWITHEGWSNPYWTVSLTTTTFHSVLDLVLLFFIGSTLLTILSSYGGGEVVILVVSSISFIDVDLLSVNFVACPIRRYVYFWYFAITSFTLFRFQIEKSLRRNDESVELRSRSGRVWTPLTLLRSLSDYYTWKES